MELVQDHKDLDLSVSAQYASLNTGSRDILDCIDRIALVLTNARAVAVVLYNQDGATIKSILGEEHISSAAIIELSDEIVRNKKALFVGQGESENIELDSVGTPLVCPRGYLLGAFCLFGEFDGNQEQLLSQANDLARLVMGELELLYDAHSRKDVESELAQQTMELKLAKVTLEQQADQLHELVDELEEAKKQVEASSKSKETFFASMSHEIRTPMNGVMGMTTLLLDTQLTDEQKGYIEVIRSSGESLLVIINDILDFSKIEAGHLDLESHPFDLINCVEDAFDLLAVKAAEKGISLGFDCHENVPKVIVGDSTRLRQVLVNLVSNAIKFTDEGQVIVRLCVAEEDKGLRLSFAVEDSGIGITKEQIGRLFKSFSQAEASTSRKYGGTGLGLAICKSICNLMGGNVWVESEPGIGSTFYFDVIMESNPESAEEIDASALENKRVLIVEHHPEIRAILAQISKNWGLDIFFATSTEEVLEEIQNDDVLDVVLLDLAMAGMDGNVIMNEVRSRHGEGKVHVIGMNPVDKKIGDKRNLFDAVLTKPVRRDALLQAMKRFYSSSVVDDTAQTEVDMHEISMAERLPLRILLVEDNVVNQKVALRLLEKLGYRADLASNGLEAVEATENIVYDLILMDVQMPEMNGLDATRQILAQTDPAKQPIIIAMTAASDEKGQMDCLNAGMKGFLSKPFQFDDLIQTLETMQLRGR